MDIFYELTYINKTSLALGYFDGLHIGHQVVIKNAINIAKRNNTTSTVIMFQEHPLKYLTNIKIEQILTLEEKLNLLEKLGVDNVVLLDFEKYSHLKAEEYIEQVLVKNFSPIAITTGFNHYFGYKKTGNSELLQKLSEKYNYKYYEIPPFVVENNIVSSSIIRNRLNLGDFFEANKLLGYNYFINGQVEKGEQIARKLGYPSANIIYPIGKVEIPHGVYYVNVEVNNKEYNGVLNYGYAPTINNESKLKTEIHILDFDQNIYGQKIKVSFVTKIRNQMKFDNIDKLKAQINRDIAFAQIYKKFLNANIDMSCKRLHF